jgi:prephenate dehydrogenase
MRVAFLGLGLIGGSVARALRRDETRRWHISAWTPDGRGPEAGRAAGVVDDVGATPESAVDGADLIVLAGPAPTCLDQLDGLAGPWAAALRPDAVITDVASTKQALVDRARTLGLRYVGGHPMAGRETSGFAASTPELFTDRPWVVVPADPSDTVAIERVEILIHACAGRPLRMDAADHDAAVAGISHLPLVVAASLVETVTGSPGWADARSLAASGWRDTTRLARGDVAMGAGMLTTNGPAVADRVRSLIDALESWAADLDGAGGPDQVRIAERLGAARGALEADVQ